MNVLYIADYIFHHLIPATYDSICNLLLTCRPGNSCEQLMHANQLNKVCIPGKFTEEELSAPNPTNILEWRCMLLSH